MKMYVGEIIDKIKDLSNSSKLLILYLQCNMVKTPSETWEQTQTVVLDYTDKNLIDYIGSNKQNFYKSIKDLIELHILFKGDKPKQYVVNPFYISCCSEKQMEDFHNDIMNKFASSQGLPPSPPIE